MNRSTIAVLVVVSGLAGCGKKAADPGATGSGSGSAVGSAVVGSGGSGSAGSAGSGSAGSGSGSAGSGSAAAATDGVMFEGKSYKFTGGKIDRAGMNQERLVLSTGPLTCDSEGEKNSTGLEIYVSAGPGGKHFAPGPFGVAAMLVRGAGSDGPGFAMAGQQLYGVLSLEPGEWKTGNKVKGSIRIDDMTEDKKATYTGSSTFEAIVCDLAANPEFDGPTAEAADKAPAAGTLGGAAFATKGAIAKLSHNKRRDVDEIEQINLYDAEVDCTNYDKAKGTMVRILGVAGSSGKDAIVGQPQPREIWWGSGSHLQGPAWINFDALEIKEGSEIKGSIFGESTEARAKKYPKSAGKLSGTFTAKVCK